MYYNHDFRHSEWHSAYDIQVDTATIALHTAADMHLLGELGVL